MASIFSRLFSTSSQSSSVITTITPETALLSAMVLPSPGTNDHHDVVSSNKKIKNNATDSKGKKKMLERAYDPPSPFSGGPVSTDAGDTKFVVMIMMMIIGTASAAAPPYSQAANGDVVYRPTDLPSATDHHHHLPSWVVGVIVALILLTVAGSWYVSCICKRRRRQCQQPDYNRHIGIEEIVDDGVALGIAAPPQGLLLPAPAPSPAPAPAPAP